MNTFRSTSGNRFTQALFYEQTGVDKSTVVYTLKDQDHLGFPSLYRLYMEMSDPLEWRFATTHLDGWEHWTILCECSWFKPYVERWRKELELKIRSEALVRIMADSTGDTKSAQMNNRILLERGWVVDATGTKGRPSKTEIRDAAQRLAQRNADQDTDLARMSPPTTPVN